MFDTETQTPFVAPAPHPARNTPPLMSVRRLSLHYGEKQALTDVSFDIYPNEVLAFIGPSGCGKSTALKCLNRMHDDTRGVRIEGDIRLHGEDVYGDDIDPPGYRRKFGWVAQKPNPFAFSIYDNVAYGARIHGLVRTRSEMDEHVEDCLRRANLWDEVKNDLQRKTGHDLSGGQQQRLCIARALSTQPEILLMDEPTGLIDPVATEAIEDLMIELSETHSVVVITHSMMQARRVAHRVAYFHLGRLLEVDRMQTVFDHPRHKETRSFVHGKVG